MTSIPALKTTWRLGPLRPRSPSDRASPGTANRDEKRAGEVAAGDKRASERNARAIATHHAALQALWRRGFL